MSVYNGGIYFSMYYPSCKKWLIHGFSFTLVCECDCDSSSIWSASLNFAFSAQHLQRPSSLAENAPKLLIWLQWLQHLLSKPRPLLAKAATTTVSGITATDDMVSGGGTSTRQQCKIYTGTFEK